MPFAESAPGGFMSGNLHVGMRGVRWARGYIKIMLAVVFGMFPGLVVTQGPVLAGNCSETYSRSDMWQFSFVYFHCTRTGWSIARRDGEHLRECAALSPDGRMIIMAADSGARHVMFRNLEDGNWLTTADQFANVMISADGLTLLQGLTQVEISAAPPLRYGFLWKVDRHNIELLSSSGQLRIGIGDASWSVSLAGSRNAINAVRTCLILSE